MKHILLSRDAFREGVFARDGGKCVFCNNPAVDAHHIIERRLWPDGGYYLANGASVCAEHHMQCETTQISVEDVRIAAGITKPIVPPHLYDDQPYDKWGNPVLPNGTRLKGELFFDESVQKVLKQGPNYGSFVDYVKYSRTHHLSWSEGVNDDDRVLDKAVEESFATKRMIVTRKMDGENTSMYRDYIHARSIDGRTHPSRSWVKQFHSQICHNIPEGWRVCGENLYAKHSIHYTDLTTYFMGFSVWDEKNNRLAWDDCLEWFELLGITPVPVLYEGPLTLEVHKEIWKPSDWEQHEGYVVATAESFNYAQFKESVGKFVRKGHVQTTKHWMYGQAVEKNLLRC